MKQETVNAWWEGTRLHCAGMMCYTRLGWTLWTWDNLTSEAGDKLENISTKYRKHFGHHRTISCQLGSFIITLWLLPAVGQLLSVVLCILPRVICSGKIFMQAAVLHAAAAWYRVISRKCSSAVITHVLGHDINMRQRRSGDTGREAGDRDISTYGF